MDSTRTVQLRRYHIEPGRVPDHVAWFPTIKAAREHHGFHVLFAFADTENDLFTWAVAVDGDDAAFTAAEEVYNASPERAKAFESNPMVVKTLDLAMVSEVVPA